MSSIDELVKELVEKGFEVYKIENPDLSIEIYARKNIDLGEGGVTIGNKQTILQSDGEDVVYSKIKTLISDCLEREKFELDYWGKNNER